MKPQSSRLQHQQKEETTEAREVRQRTTGGRTFESPEEMLRADAAQTDVPASVKTRLAESVQQAVAARKPARWWQRWRRRRDA